MIRLLDQSTIDKIAAGEVIERPSSVVKELLENSIDAGATAVTVEIKDGGMSFIRVTDNGCGIPREEVATAYLRHATSKIETAEDLTGISSLGFRGEALSTIAAVSQCEMVTKTAAAMIGLKYVIHGGDEIEAKEVGVPDGTTIVVRNLFYNTPARKKFLKTPMTEGSYIADLVLRIALSHPEISIKLIVNGQTKINTSGNGNIKDNIYELFGRDITSNLIEISYSGSDGIGLFGYIGKPFIARGNRGLENYFVNKRYIKSNVVNRAIEEGYKTFVMQHKFPFTVLYIDLPAEKCDINVHPTKMEFKYDNEKALFEVITKQIREALSGREIIPKETSEEKNNAAVQTAVKAPRPAEPFEHVRKMNEAAKEEAETEASAKQTSMPKPNVRAEKYSPTYKILESLKKTAENTSGQNPGYVESINKTQETYNRSGTIDAITSKETADGINYAENIENTILRDEGVQYTHTTQKKQQSVETTRSMTGRQETMFEDDFLTKSARKKHRLIGQLFGTYWLIEYENNLYIMDQHAAHEKVKYEELIRGLNSRETYSQQLMPPMVVTVTYAEKQAILNNYDLFMRTGYDIEEFGGNEFKINAVPSNIYGIHERAMFMEFVGSLINNSGYMSDDVFIKKLSTMACKAAIKGNMHISFAEADALIDQLLALENPYTCPHGRPTIISISMQELEKKFKRVL
ncbi:MAG: DNA mismatch repair endonuclease MutL [Clostridium sp.]|nr:DNA mismatch repair endonuclease MutL [Clostridium sp.]MCM1208473.1 DNA mismatch repair endonuclease MutL [Ruminococcus sp.]